VENLDKVSAGSALLIIPRSILQDVASAKCFTVTTCFNKVKGLDFVSASRIVLVVSRSNVFLQLIEDFLLIVFPMVWSHD